MGEPKIPSWELGKVSKKEGVSKLNDDEERQGKEGQELKSLW